jgi:surface antigen
MGHRSGRQSRIWKLFFPILAVVGCCAAAVWPASAARHRSHRLHVTIHAGHFSGEKRLLRVSFRSAKGAICRVGIRARQSSDGLPALKTDAKGHGGWSWVVPRDAPSARWHVRVDCGKGQRRGHAGAAVRVRTENRKGTRGDLIEHSTVRVLAGTPTSPTGIGGAGNLYPVAQCTWWAKEKRPDVGNDWGNAGDWLASAQRANFPTGTAPVKGAIVVFAPGQAGAGSVGHVAFVEDVLAGNQIRISEYNWVPYTYGERIISADGLHFIYGGPADGGPNTPPPPPPSPSPQPGQEFVSDASTSGFAQSGGVFHSASGGGSIGGSYLYLENYLACRNDVQRGSASWTLGLPNGVYDVYAYIPSNVPNDAAPLAIDYTVNYREGSTKVREDQHYNAGRWMQLAHLGFNGTSSVVLDDIDYQNGTCYRKYIAVDAVKWVYRGP